ncbi:MAG: CHRD domain-containing protein [Gemmatimonadaceae bacterium]
MKRSSLVAVAGLLAVTSSAAFAALRHMDYTVTITGKDGAAVHGSGMAKSEDKTTEVEIKLMGDVAGSVRPWHIHVGSCAKAGGIFGGARSYTPITIDAKGEGTTKATVPASLPDTGTYYVNIHESAANMGKIVACGDLKMKM